MNPEDAEIRIELEALLARLDRREAPSPPVIEDRLVALRHTISDILASRFGK